MTKDEALDLALEALECLMGRTESMQDALDAAKQARESITAIKQARSAPVQEPVGEVCGYYERGFDAEKTRYGKLHNQDLPLGIKLYTTPPAAPVQDDIPKLGCVNHDCDKCKAAEKLEPVAWADMGTRDVDNDAGLSWTPGHFHATHLYTTPPAQKFVCSTGLCHFTLTQTNVGIGERGMEAYEAAKERGWVGVSDERLMEMSEQKSEKRECMNCAAFGECNPNNDAGRCGYEPPAARRQWVGLSQDEFRDFASTFEYGTGGLIRAIEAKLREKNAAQ